MKQWWLVSGAALLGAAALVALLVGRRSGPPLPLYLKGPCQVERAFQIAVSHQVSQGMPGLDPSLRAGRAEARFVFSPVVHENPLTLYRVSAAIRGKTPVACFVSLSSQGVVKQVFVPPDTAEASMDSVRPFLGLLQHPANVKRQSTQNEPDELGVLQVRYSPRSDGFDKERVRYEGDIPTEFVHSDWRYRWDEGALLLEATEERLVAVTPESKATIRVRIEARETDSRSEQRLCVADSIAGFVASQSLRESSLLLQGDPIQVQAQKKERTQAETVDSLWSKVRTAATESERYRLLHDLTVLMELRPGAVEEVEKLILLKRSLDQEFMDLVGALASAEAPEQPAAMRRLLQAYESQPEMAEKVVRTYQLSMRVHPENFDLLWRFWETHPSPPVKEAAIYAVGTGLHRAEPSPTRTQYLDRLIDGAMSGGSNQPNALFVAALGNAGANESAPLLLQWSKREGANPSGHATAALRFIETKEVQDHLLSLAQQSRDLERHDEAIFALRFHRLTPSLARGLKTASEKLPEREQGRKALIREMLTGTKMGGTHGPTSQKPLND